MLDHPFLKPRFDDFPHELTGRPQWVIWRYETRGGKRTKVPYQARYPGRGASVTDPATWCDIATARAAYEQDPATDADPEGGFAGVGFVLSESDSFCAVDLDHVIGADGVPSEDALAIVAALDTYAEVSPSGTGLHLFAVGNLPPEGRKRGGVECYESNRYLTVTGHKLPTAPPSVNERQREIDNFHARHFPTDPPPERERRDAAPLDLSDTDLLALAFKSANGGKIAALYAGSTAGYAGPSESDAALCALLAFYCGDDPARLERLMRGSALSRDKWDDRRGTETWIGSECRRAVAKCANFYDPPGTRNAGPNPPREGGQAANKRPAPKWEPDLGGAAAGGASAYDMEAFIRRHGLAADAPDAYKGGTRWRMDCPFNADHRKPDAALYVTERGVAAFHCSHNSCAGYDWRTLRAKYENPFSHTPKTPKTPPADGFGGFGGTSSGESREDAPPPFPGKPRPLAAELLPVPPFDAALLPAALRPWVRDIAERGSFPVEYVAAAALAALSSVVGRRCGIRPKRFDDWLVVPNLWGMIVGKPGVFKSPALAEAVRPLARLEHEARENYKAEVARWDAETRVAEALAKAAKSKLNDAARKAQADPDDLRRMAREASAGETDRPICPRFYVNDATAEKLQELLGENPDGLLLLRDELSGWLRTLDKQGHENDKSFYLEAWNGTAGYTSDRIGRGTTFCDAACVSVLGTIQPGVLARYLRGATSGDTADGLMPRFQLMVYPDAAPRFVNVDRYPDADGKNGAFAVFTRLAALQPADVRAELSDGVPAIPFLRFAPDAQTVFDAWRGSLENRLRSDADGPALTEHLAKYRSLLPSVALLLHLAGDTPGAGAVPAECVTRAVSWCDLLEAHARRVYGAAYDAPLEAAELLAARIKASLPTPFTVRDVAKKGWSGLTDAGSVRAALDVLEDRGWVRLVEREPDGVRGGRPTVDVYVHPDIQRGNPAFEEGEI